MKEKKTAVAAVYVGMYVYSITNSLTFTIIECRFKPVLLYYIRLAIVSFSLYCENNKFCYICVLFFSVSVTNVELLIFGLQNLVNIEENYHKRKLNALELYVYCEKGRPNCKCCNNHCFYAYESSHFDPSETFDDMLYQHMVNIVCVQRKNMLKIFKCII